MQSKRHVSDADLAVPEMLARALRDVALSLILALLIALAYLAFVSAYLPSMAALYFIDQDVWWLVLAILFRWVLVSPRFWRLLFRGSVSRFESARISISVLSCAILIATFVGTYVVHQDFNLTNDELMASFDAKIFQHGLFMAPIPLEWRSSGSGLLPAFGFPIADHAAWVSVYLPGNAAFRAIVGTFAPMQLANPILASIAVWAVYSIARQLWPHRPDAAILASLMLATSSQMLLMATTGFAMTGHLALNLLWLRLFLRNDAIGHAVAIAIGFVATGWHQLVFHPLLVAPFVLHMWWSRRWQRALTYTLAYAFIALFWIHYRQLVLWWAGVLPEAIAASGGSYFLDTVFELISKLSFNNLAVMFFSLLRFVAWQNPLLPALVLVGLFTIRRCPVPIRLAALGFFLTIIVVVILLPEQGHGWGYRYLHGFIGMACLLGASGWILAVPVDCQLARRFRIALSLSCGYVAIVQLPGQSLQIRAWIDPFVKAATAIQAAPVDIVVVDGWGVIYSHRLVRNDPFLRNRPVMLWLKTMAEDELGMLCRRANHIGIFDQSSAKRYRLPTFQPKTEPRGNEEDRKRLLLRRLPCVSAEAI